MDDEEHSSNQSPPEHRFVIGLRKFGTVLLGLGSALACVLMICLFLVGFCLIFKAVWTTRYSWSPISTEGSHLTDPGNAIVKVLHGLEFFFLAPLPALVFFSLARFFKSFQSVNRSSRNFADESASAHQLHRIKAFVVSLMTASVATDLLGKTFQGISWQTVIAESTVLVLLGVYWFTLHRICSNKATL
jgi:hypothetical protein